MTLMKNALGALAFMVPLALMPLNASAAKLNSVVELFTSQGCSSCPPADAFLHELDTEEDVLALAFHVDYWDYLGWKDTLALPQNTNYQRDYQKVFKYRSIYTPQLVVNGRDHVVGSDRKSIRRELAHQTTQNKNLTVDVSLTEVDGKITIDAAAQDLGGKDAVVEIVYFRPKSDIVVERGENAGRTLTYTNAVTKVDTLGVWMGGDKTFNLPLTKAVAGKSENCAVLIREMRKDGLPGAIIGAAVLN